jgi:hypothetical protein
MSILKQVIFVLCFCFLFGGSVHAQSAFEDPGARSQGGSGGDLVAVNSKIDAGEVALGSSSQIVVLMRNDGSKPITSGEISLYPSSNVSASVAQNECSERQLLPGAVCAIALSIKGLQPGRFRMEMLMRHDGRAKLITSTISGLVDITNDSARDVINDLETIPQDIAFGSLKESRPLTRSVILRNVTSKPIEISSIDIESNDSAGYSLKTNCDKLESGAACITTVTWAPQQRGPATGVLVVNHDGPTGVVSVILEGEYQPDNARQVGVFPEAVPGKGLLTASQVDVDFGSGIESSSSITVSLVNVGDAPVELKDIRLSNEDTGIKISKIGCAKGKVLEPVEACPLTLTWEPVRTGNVLDDVQVVHDGARGILVLPIRGASTKAVNQDSKSIVFDEGLDTIIKDIDPVSVSGSKPKVTETKPKIVTNVASLEGYRITSMARDRAIVSGPGGSRVVFDGQESVVGGGLWQISVQTSAVQFKSGKKKVLLLFDKSLAPTGAVAVN